MTEEITKPKTIMLFSNGNVAAFDDNGQQIPELQQGWLELWLKWIESKGVDPTEIPTIETVVNGRNVYLKPFRVDDGWNVSISEF